MLDASFTPARSPKMGADVGAGVMRAEPPAFLLTDRPGTVERHDAWNRVEMMVGATDLTAHGAFSGNLH